MENYCLKCGSRLNFNEKNNKYTCSSCGHSFYEKNICIYSSHGPFIKDDTSRLSYVVFKANRIKEQENDTELFVKNLWQEANLSNGKIFPFVQAFVAIVSLVCLILAFDLKLINERIVLSCVAAGSCLLLLVISFIFVMKTRK